MHDQYRTVTRVGVHETEINRSRFRCAPAPAGTGEKAREFIARVREEHPTATHNCFAYVIGADASVRRASDDGEPVGTAGAPVLRMLPRREARYTVAVVTRYYGGVELGAGGLIRAYGRAVGEALDAVGTRTGRRFRRITVTVGHRRADRLENDLRATGHVVRAVRYAEAVTIDLGPPEVDMAAFRAWLADTTAGTVTLEPGRVGEVPSAWRRPARTLAALSESPGTSGPSGDAGPPPCDRARHPRGESKSRDGASGASAVHRTPPGPPCGRTTPLLKHAPGGAAYGEGPPM